MQRPLRPWNACSLSQSRYNLSLSSKLVRLVAHDRTQNMLHQALTALARAKHPTGACYASFSKMCCQYTSVLPVAIPPQHSPTSLLDKHQQHNQRLLLVLMQLGGGLFSVVRIAVRTSLPDCKQDLYFGWRNPAQLTPNLHHQRKLTRYFPLIEFSHVT